MMRRTNEIPLYWISTHSTFRWISWYFYIKVYNKYRHYYDFVLNLYFNIVMQKVLTDTYTCLTLPFMFVMYGFASITATILLLAGTKEMPGVVRPSIEGWLPSACQIGQGWATFRQPKGKCFTKFYLYTCCFFATDAPWDPVQR